MRKGYSVNALLCVLLLGGCVSEEWVKSYVGQEITATKENLGQEIAATKANVRSLKQAMNDTDVQIRLLRKGIGNVNERLSRLARRLAELAEGLEKADRDYEKALGEVKKALAGETAGEIKDLNKRLQRLGAELTAFQENIAALEGQLKEAGKVGGSTY